MSRRPFDDAFHSDRELRRMVNIDVHDHDQLRHLKRMIERRLGEPTLVPDFELLTESVRVSLRRDAERHNNTAIRLDSVYGSMGHLPKNGVRFTFKLTEDMVADVARTCFELGYRGHVPMVTTFRKSNEWLEASIRTEARPAGGLEGSYEHRARLAKCADVGQVRDRLAAANHTAFEISGRWRIFNA